MDGEWEQITWQQLQQMQAAPAPPVGKFDRLMDQLELGEILRRAVPNRQAAHKLKISLGKAAGKRGMKLGYQEAQDGDGWLLAVYRIDKPEAPAAPTQQARRRR